MARQWQEMADKCTQTPSAHSPLCSHAQRSGHSAQVLVLPCAGNPVAPHPSAREHSPLAANRLLLRFCNRLLSGCRRLLLSQQVFLELLKLFLQRPQLELARIHSCKLVPDVELAVA